MKCTELRTLDLEPTPNLKSLTLTYCDVLEEINAPAEYLKKLFYLYIIHSGRFKSFKFDKKHDSTEVVSLSELHLTAHASDAYDADETDDADDTDDTDETDDTNETDDTDDADDTNDADDTGICDPANTWPEFEFSCDYKEDPASSFGNLERLISLGFSARMNTDSFSDIICGLQCLRKLTLEGGIPEVPKNLDRLDCLEELSLLLAYIKTLPDSICMLKYLKSLELESCHLFEKLPVDIGRLECLESLILSKCILLQDLPNSICAMKRLKCLKLTGCIQVENLPAEIGRLKCLKELNVLASGISHLPDSLYGLKGIHIIGHRWLLESCGLTPKRRRMFEKNSDLNNEMSDQVYYFDNDEWSATLSH